MLTYAILLDQVHFCTSPSHLLMNFPSSAHEIDFDRVIGDSPSYRVGIGFIRLSFVPRSSCTARMYAVSEIVHSQPMQNLVGI